MAATNLPDAFSFPRTRNMYHGAFRGTATPGASSSPPGGIKAARICLDRIAEDARKSRLFWWRLLAVASTTLLFGIAVTSLINNKLIDAPSSQILMDSKSLLLKSASIEKANVDNEADRAEQLRQAKQDDSRKKASQVLTMPLKDETVKSFMRRLERRREELRADEFCKKLLQNPQPADKMCRRQGSNMTCTNGQVQMFSQFKQDYYLYDRHFKNLKRTGTYIDVAANDAVQISNTYFFDRCLLWRGICVEGNPFYFDRIYRLRTCALVPTCVGKTEGEAVNFGLMGGASGVVGGTNKHMETWARQKREVHTLRERCTTVGLLMDKEQMPVVDYMSLDVEGHELDVLKGIDWDRAKINVLTIEVSQNSSEQITEFLVARGYRIHTVDIEGSRGKLGSDLVFLHNDLVWGDPQ